MGNIEAFLDLLVAAGVAQGLMIYMVAIRVPSLESQQLVDLFDELLLGLGVLVHVQIFHQVVNSDLSR